MEEAQDSKSVKKEMKEEPDIEEAITRAMRARVGHFKKQADSLTLEGVRRVLEKELGLEKFALDVHKRFIKQCLQECFDGAGDENISKTSGQTVEEIIHSKKEETPEFPEELQLQTEVKEPSSEDEEKMQGSPILGLLGADKSIQNETEKTEDIQFEEVPSEDTIKKAVRKRASYFKANSETVTMVGARRLLEEDLKLDKGALDPYKKFISEQLDKVLQSPEVAEPTNGVKNKLLKKDSHSKVAKKVSSKESSESMGSEGEVDEDEDEDEERSKKKVSAKGKIQKSDGLKSHKRSAKETKTFSNKRKKLVEPVSDEGSDAKDGGNLSEDGHSQSSAEEPVKKKKEVSTQVYGKRVEHLKSVIKSCGMSIPPAVYRRAKQAPESKREAYLIKELEEILDREGLSTNPSEKEIKAVRKKKERTKELEGIDVSNIVSSSRRRSTSNFIFPPPKPKVPVESDKDDEEEDTDDEDDEDDSNSEGESEGLNEDVEDGSEGGSD